MLERKIQSLNQTLTRRGEEAPYREVRSFKNGPSVPVLK